MYETDDELAALQELLTESFDRAGSHLKAMFEETLTAKEVAAQLEGIFEVHFATVTPIGAPLVAPIDALFFYGKLWIGTPTHAVRARYVRRDPRVSI